MFLSFYFSMIESLKMRLFSSLAGLILMILLLPEQGHCGLQRNPAVDKQDDDILDLRGEIFKIQKEILHGLQGEVQAEKSDMMEILSTIELIKQESTNYSSILAEIKRKYRLVMNSITGFNTQKEDYHNMTETVQEVVKESNETKERLPAFHVRLVQGRSQTDGRVELFSAGQWGTVCDDGWDNADANVVCLMLGLSGPGHAIGNAVYGEGTGPIWMRRVNCKGNETTLADCRQTVWVAAMCSHSNDAGVICGQLSDVDVRLVKGRSQSDGRVEFFFHGQWGTVCNDGWDNADANVVCHMLGLSGPGHAIGNAVYGEGTGPIWMRRVNCKGNETTLLDCTHSIWGTAGGCSHSEDVGVFCGLLSDIHVRLVKGRSQTDGRVEIFFLGEWGTVCDDGWDNSDANVVCRMLGLSGPGHAIGNAVYGKGTGPIWMRKVNCKGNETTLVDCLHPHWGTTGCSHRRDAGVICGQLPDVDVRLVQGRSQSYGRVELFFLGQWGTVCDDGWDNEDANVVCRMLGISGPGYAFGNAVYGKGSGPIWLRRVNCEGNETSLVDCLHPHWGSSGCRHSMDAGIICGQPPDIDIRLVQGRSQTEGRVEMSFLGQWGTVCDERWDNEDANVVCRMLGLSGPGHAIMNSAYGEGKGRIWMRNVNCEGNETTLMDCPHEFLWSAGCRHSQDAGVICGQLPDVDVRLVQGRSQRDGRVELFFLGQWGRVCDVFWDNRDANVVCRMLGLSGPGLAIVNSFYGKGAGPVWVSQVDCNGNETTLVNCPHNTWGDSVGCHYGEDVGVICGHHSDVYVRLVQGRSESDGRVEIFILGQWGTVCDDGWDNEDANVVCRMLGLSGPGHAIGNTVYGEGAGPIWMRKVNCEGNETTLVDCPHSSWGTSPCIHSEDAGVICGQLPDIDVRLVQGRSQTDGRVEIFFLGQWGTVCDDEWDIEDANVVCRMLGLSGPGHAIGNAVYGEGAGPIWMSTVNCNGNETTLVDCPHSSWRNSFCRHSDDAGVICGHLPAVDVRLAQGRSQSDGRVELFFLDQWGTVCDFEWDNTDANVVCRMLGFSGPGHAIGNAVYGVGTGPIWMRKVNCTGNETTLVDCPRSSWGTSHCRHSDDAGVICGHLPDVNVRLVQGRSQSEGRVEVFFLGEWGTVCDDGWDNPDANVVCRMLGFNGPGHAIGNAAYGEGAGPIWMRRVNCKGNETNMVHCLHPHWGSTGCIHSWDAGVICGQLPDVDVRMVQGRSQREGRVEFFFLGKWGTVCDDGWDNADANVVCRMLGLSGPGHAFGNAVYGEGAGPIWMTGVHCNGNETTLMDCPHSSSGTSGCSHSSDAGVICGQLPGLPAGQGNL